MASDVDASKHSSVTIVFFAYCDGLLCKGSVWSATSAIKASASLKRDTHFHIPIVWDRETAPLPLKEGSMTYMYGRGTDEKKTMYYAVDEPLLSQFSPDFVVSQGLVVNPHFSTDEDLPSTQSGLLGTTYDLSPGQTLIIGFHLKKAATGQSIVSDFTQLSFIFSLGTEPKGSDFLPQHVCPRVVLGAIEIGDQVIEPVLASDELSEEVEAAMLTKETCNSSEKQLSYCLLFCANKKMLVEECSCDPVTKKPTVSCTNAPACKDVISSCGKVCDESPLSQCKCDLSDRATTPVAAECGDTYDPNELNSDDFVVETTSASTLTMTLAPLLVLFLH